MNSTKFALAAAFFILYLGTVFADSGSLVTVGQGQNFTKENSLTFENGFFSFNEREIILSFRKKVQLSDGVVRTSSITPKTIYPTIEDNANYYKFDANVQILPYFRNKISQIYLNIYSNKPVEKFSETSYRVGNYVIDFSDAINTHNEKSYPEKIYDKGLKPTSYLRIKNVELLDNGKVVFNNIADKNVFSLDPIIIPVTDITEDTIWHSGNTYFITSIVNVTNSATLTIEPGAIIKFKQGSYLNISGGYIKAQGEPNNKIHFTSCKDQTVGEDLSAEIGCDGTPAGGNYPYAIYYDNLARVSTDTNDLFDLNFSFAKNAIYIYGISLNSVHDCYFQNNISYDTDGAAIYLQGGKIANLYNNSFLGNKARWGGAIAIKTSGTSSIGKIVNLYKNVFTYNEAMGEMYYYAGGGAIYSYGGKITNLHDNVFLRNKATNMSHMEGGAIYGYSWDNNERIKATIENMYNNVFSENKAMYGGTIYLTGWYAQAKIENVYNNLFLRNEGIFYCGGIHSLEGTVNNIYNNLFFNNKSGYGGDAILGRDILLRNNVFAFHKEAIRYADSNYNAYWQNEVNCYNGCEAHDVNFTAPPFLGDGSDRNFLIVPNQINLVRDAGINIGDDNFFNTRTIGVDNEPDIGIRDIGYHYELAGVCNNGLKDGDETDVDCGGNCLACEEGMHCLQDGDCISGHCNQFYDQCDVPADLYIEWIKPIQVVEDTPLVAGKATVVRVKVVNDGPEAETDVSINYGNGCFTETKPVLIKAFSSKTVDFYPPNNCTHT